MDPLTNPTPTPNPVPTPGPTPASDPASGGTPIPSSASSTGEPANIGGVNLQPEGNIAGPEVTTPVALTPLEAPAMPGVDVAPASGVGANPTPGINVSPTPGVDVTPVPGVASNPVNPIINPTAPVVGAPVFNPGGVSATDPIMMPEPAPAPDPVEEELKAPMKAAEPVPGSIGSAVSGPEGVTEANVDGNVFAGNKQVPNVSFTDPATRPENTTPGMNMVPTKKKTNKKTLIALIVVAGMVVIALVAVLILQLMNNTPSAPTSTPNNPTVIEPEEQGSSDTNSNTSVTGSLSCTRNMTSVEVAEFNDALSGTISASAKFGDDNLLTSISLVKSVVYSDEDATNNEPVETDVHESTADDLTLASAPIYSLPVNDAGELELTKEAIQENYESLDFTCEVL